MKSDRQPVRSDSTLSILFHAHFLRIIITRKNKFLETPFFQKTGFLVKYLKNDR
jgi:hypothetical protein